MDSSADCGSNGLQRGFDVSNCDKDRSFGIIDGICARHTARIHFRDVYGRNYGWVVAVSSSLQNDGPRIVHEVSYGQN